MSMLSVVSEISFFDKSKRRPLIWDKIKLSFINMMIILSGHHNINTHDDDNNDITISVQINRKMCLYKCFSLRQESSITTSFQY